MKLHDKHIFHSMEIYDSVNSGALEEKMKIFSYDCSDTINVLVNFFGDLIVKVFICLQRS